jgi:NADH-quinone oxidoreductase subunit A
MIPVIDWSAIVFILAAIGLCIFMLVVPRLLGGTSKGFQKQENFESGVVSAGSARIRLSAKFYIVAIFFIIFDLEALYLYTYAVSVREAGWLGFWTAVLFVVELLIGLYYLLKLGALNWSPADKKPKPKLSVNIPRTISKCIPLPRLFTYCLIWC